MRTIAFIFMLLFLHSCTSGKEGQRKRTYVASTPAHSDVRQFLGISPADSIDFIRWELILHNDQYELSCRYGIGKPNTNGFIDEIRVAFAGRLTKNGNYYSLQQGDRVLWILELNPNLMHLLDKNKALLIGNGGWSYTLNNATPVKTDEFHLPVKESGAEPYMVFEGRTPCRDLPSQFDLSNNPTCYKLKWLFVFFTDSITGRPSYFLAGGRNYRRETMDKGKWEIVQGKDGRQIYKVNYEKRGVTLYLLRVDDNVLVFTNPDGHLLVGNKDFSYTLNRSWRKMPS